MNFFKYQNFPARDAPSDPRTVASTVPEEYQLNGADSDEVWIQNWLVQHSIYQPIPKVRINNSSVNISISDSRNSLRECLILLEKLTEKQQDLHRNVDLMSSTEWKEKTVEIGALKDKFTKLMSKFDHPDAVFALKKSIEKRKKKRLKEKTRRELLKEKKMEKEEVRRKIHKDVDDWLNSMKEEAEKAKMEEDMKKDADCVLAEVTKKKSDARKQLSLIASLTKLRLVRDQMAVQRGEKLSLEDRQAFNITTEKLIRMWESSMKTYSTEEQGLRLMIEKNSEKDSMSKSSAKERRLLEDWHAVFFGPRMVVPHDGQTYWALTAAERDTETFVAIRKSWDTFLVPSTNEMGSKIPMGWVLPDQDVSESWAKYLDKN